LIVQNRHRSDAVHGFAEALFMPTNVDFDHFGQCSLIHRLTGKSLLMPTKNVGVSKVLPVPPFEINNLR
jgi:hypothetical protein